MVDRLLSSYLRGQADHGFRIQDTEYRIQDTGFKIQDLLSNKQIGQLTVI